MLSQRRTLGTANAKTDEYFYAQQNRNMTGRYELTGLSCSSSGHEIVAGRVSDWAIHAAHPIDQLSCPCYDYQ